MLILQVLPDSTRAYGGPVTTAEGLRKVFRNLGHQCALLTTKTDGKTPWEKQIVVKRTFPARFSNSQYAIKWIHRNATKYNFVILHGIWMIVNLRASWVLRHYKIPYIVIPHGSLDPFDLQKKKLLKRILGPRLIKNMLASSAVVLCSSEREAKYMVTYGAKCNVQYLPWPCCASVTNGNRGNFRNKHGITDKQFVFLFLARIDYKKGLELLLPALKVVESDYPESTLVICGSGKPNYERKIWNLCSVLQLQKRVIVTGFLSGQDKEDAFAGSDCFVLPSQNENFGHSIIEALAAGLPVLISRNVYIQQYLVADGCAWICENTVVSLVQQMRNVLTNPDEYLAKKRASIHASARFLPENLMEDYHRFIEGLNIPDYRVKS